MNTLMVSVSGVRGIVGSSLRPDIILKYTAAFCQLLKQNYKTDTKKMVVLGRDSRVSGPWIFSIVEGIFQAMGIEVLNVGIVPTPTVQFVVIKEKALGGLIITSSHNPVEWNGLKFVDADGLFISPDKCKELFELADNHLTHITWPSYDSLGKIISCHDAYQQHVKAILQLPELDRKLVTDKKYKVCLDAVNGAGGKIMQHLLEELGCTVIGLNLEPTGIFAHAPEPLPENLTQLCEAVKQHQADMGIATDPDVDRCVFIDETGNAIGEEYTLAMAVQFWLGVCGKRGPVCRNLSSSRAIDDIAKKYGCPVYGTPVGEIHVAKKMLEVGAVIGGEGNGGVMLPDVHIGRDAPVAAALSLQLLAHSNLTLSKLKHSLPQWTIVKKKISIEGINDLDTVIESVVKEWQAKGAQVDRADGVRIDTEEWWVHLRKSNTEPIVRVIGEAHTQEAADSIVDRIMSMISKK